MTAWMCKLFNSSPTQFVSHDELLLVKGSHTYGSYSNVVFVVGYSFQRGPFELRSLLGFWERKWDNEWPFFLPALRVRCCSSTEPLKQSKTTTSSSSFQGSSRFHSLRHKQQIESFKWDFPYCAIFHSGNPGKVSISLWHTQSDIIYLPHHPLVRVEFIDWDKFGFLYPLQLLHNR